MSLRHHNFSRLASGAQRARDISSSIVSLLWDPKERHPRRALFIFSFSKCWSYAMLHLGSIRPAFEVELASCSNLRSLEGKLQVCCCHQGFRTLAFYKSSHVGIFLCLCGLLASTGLTDGPSQSLSVTRLHLLIYSVSGLSLCQRVTNLKVPFKIESHPTK